VASDVPRRYASIVYKKGLKELEKLPEASKAYLPPLPIVYDPEQPAYKEMMEMMKDMPHANDRLPKAQAIKDATMAHFILQNFTKGQQFLHFEGSYHSDNFQGIVWYLKQANPDLKIMTISCVEQSEVNKLQEDSKGVASFIVAINEDMTKTQ
jgi:uncharacterized iron-regulated protein